MTREHDAWCGAEYPGIPCTCLPLAPEVGGFYKTRGGATVFIFEKRHYILNNVTTAGFFFIGIYVACGSRCTWQSDGAYSIHPHSTGDIVAVS